jgi:hypothetical protein
MEQKDARKRMPPFANRHRRLHPPSVGARGQPKDMARLLRLQCRGASQVVAIYPGLSEQELDKVIRAVFAVPALVKYVLQAPDGNFFFFFFFFLNVFLLSFAHRRRT